MVSLSIIWKTLTVAKNPLTVLSMKRKNSRRTVTFRNGKTFNLTWSQFRLFRDNYQTLERYSIVQIKDDAFKITSGRSTVVCGAQVMPLVCDLMDDFDITQTEEGAFSINKGDFKVIGTTDILVCVKELQAGEYEGDYQGRTVLDIGGFQGDSAAYFWSRKAKKVIIFEPVDDHVPWIRKNIQLNNMNADVHVAGIGNENGTRIMQYDQADIGFGLQNDGSKSMEIKIRNVSDVILESGADTAKIDCEGAEESLIHVSTEILQKIPTYMIEVHTPEIREAILEKFNEAGFILDNERIKSKFSILTFKIRGFQR